MRYSEAFGELAHLFFSFESMMDDDDGKEGGGEECTSDTTTSSRTIADAN